MVCIQTKVIHLYVETKQKCDFNTMNAYTVITIEITFRKR